MYFLIDYENVKNQGMQGTQYLLSSDHVILFYSATVPHMEQCYLKDIRDSGCGYEICKLLKQRKNGLDFYIATKLGAIFGAGLANHAVIISNDTGFLAVKDYWQDRSGTKKRVAIAENIERGIITSGETSERATIIRTSRKMVDIGQSYAAFQEHLKLRRALQAALEGTAYTDRLQELQEIVETGRSPKVIYLDSLRRFGRKSGQEVYRILKSCSSQ